MNAARHFSRVLITGIAGSGGSYLAEHIVGRHPAIAVHGITRWHSTATPRNLAAIADKVTTHECDLCDFGSVLNVLDTVRPDAIFHLASHANVRAGFTTPLSVLYNNIMGTANLFQAVLAAKLDPLIQLCSTSEVYGQVNPEDVPIKESCPLRPSSPYAVSKTTQDHLGFTYWRCYGLKIIRTRMFAYLNPRREDLFATAFAKQVALIEAGKRHELVHGNLESVRTMIDVRDAMDTYWLAATLCEPGEVYNIGGTAVVTVGGFLEALKERALCQIPSRLDPALLRPADVTLQIPDTSKFHAATAWTPRYSFNESVDLLLDHWRRTVGLADS